MHLMYPCFRHWRFSALLVLLLLTNIRGQHDSNLDNGSKALEGLLGFNRCTAGAAPRTYRHLAYVGVAWQVEHGAGEMGVSICTPPSLIPIVPDAVTELFSTGSTALGPSAKAEVTSCSWVNSTPPGSADTEGQPSGTVSQPSFSLKTINVSNGIITSAAAALGDLAPANALLALRDLAVVDARFSFADILVPLRRKLLLGQMGGVSVLPLDAPVLLMVYRQDVLSAMLPQVPRTWDELANFVESYNNSRPAWGPSSAFCATTGETNDGLSLFSAIWHSFAQSHGLSQGVYFDPGTMEPLVRTPAFMEAAQLFTRIWPQALAQPDGVHGFSHPGLRQGACAVAIGTFQQVKDVALRASQPQQLDVGSNPNGAVQADAPVSVALNASAFAVTQAPGSHYVLSRAHPASLVPCTEQDCPFGDAAATPMVNRAPYIPSNLLVGGITTRSTVAQRLLAWHILSYLAGPEESLNLLQDPGSILSPFRLSHFTSSARSAWADAGYDAVLVNQGLDAQQAALMHPNVAWGIHMRDGGYYRYALSGFLRTLISDSASAPVQSSIDRLKPLANHLYQQLNSYYSSSNGTSAQYRAFINNGTVGQQVELPSMPTNGTAASGGNGRAVDLGVAITVAGLAVLFGGLCVAYRCGYGPLRRRQGHSWRPDAPAVSPNTTLVITDIEGSTRLWEELPEVVMGCALRLHHACLRRVLVRHRGYESATEGDSFILAFHRPEAALAFAVEAQQELLEQEWPAELLANEACAPVYTYAPAGFPFRRPATLETVLSCMSIRPHSHTSVSGGGGGGGPFATTPSAHLLLTHALPASLVRAAFSRISLAQSPSVSQAHLRSSPGPHQRMSIDLGLLNKLNREGKRMTSGCKGATYMGTGKAEDRLKQMHPSMPVPRAAPLMDDAAMEPCRLVAPVAVEAVSPSATDSTAEVSAALLVNTPLSRGNVSSHMSLNAQLSRAEGGEIGLVGSQQLQHEVLAKAPGCNGAHEPQLVSAFVLQGRSRSPLAQNTEALPPQHQVLMSRKPGGLSRKLQQQQQQQLIAVHQPQQQQQQQQQHPNNNYQQHQADLHQNHAREEPFVPGSSLASSSGWAIIHGGETVAVLEEQIKGSADGGGPAGSDAPATACDKDGELIPDYVFTPSTVLAPTASASRTPTGSGIVARPFDGANAISVRDPGEPGVVECTGGSEPLFKLSQDGRASREGGAVHAQRVSPITSPSPSVMTRPQTLLMTAGRSSVPPGASQETVYVTGGAATWEVCTLEQSLKAAVRGLDEGGPTDRKRRLLWRGLRIRMGLHAGISSESELTYNRASARTVYSGECASIVRVVADSAQGGLVLLSEACMEAVTAAASVGALHGTAAEALLINIGRYRIGQPSAVDPTGSGDYDPTTAMTLFLAIGLDLAARAAILPPPRKITAVGLPIYAAPVGRAAIACLNVPDISLLRDFDEGATGQALELMRRAVLEQLASHRGYLVSEDWEQGSLSAAFAFPLDAVRWALRCREVLSSASLEWPAALLMPRLCSEEELPREHLEVAAAAMAAAATSCNSAHVSRGDGGGGGGGGPLHGSGFGPLLSPMPGRGRTRNSLDLAHALTTSCDNTLLWGTPLGAASLLRTPSVFAPAGAGGACVQGAAAEGAGAAEDVGVLCSRQTLSAIVRRGSQASYILTLDPRAGSTPAELDSAPTAPAPPTVPRHTFRGLASSAAIRGVSPQAHSAFANAATLTGTYPRTGQETTAAAVAAAAPPPALLVGSVAADDMEFATGISAGATQRATIYLTTRVGALSSRLRISSGGAYPEGTSDGAGNGSIGGSALSQTLVQARAGYTVTPLGVAATVTAAATTGSVGGEANAVAASLEPGGVTARESAGTADTAGRSSGGGVSHRVPKGLTVKTPPTWAQSDDMEDTEDGGDIFSLHLGGMEGCSPHSRGPAMSQSDGFAICGTCRGAGAAAAVASQTAGALRGEVDVADRQNAVILHGPRIRVGIDCGLVEWGISSSHQGLTYSGAPVAAAEKLASMAAAGQVLSTYVVMLEMHRLQATLGIPLEAEEAAAASAERGSRTGFGSEAAFRGPAVVSTPLPPPSGRAGLASARQRRQQIFACRFTNDWEEALRESDQLMAQQASAHHSVSGWSSPRSGRLSPFSSPWNWSTAGRRSKRPSSIAPAPSLQGGESRRSNTSRRSFDLFGKGVVPLLPCGLSPQPPQNATFDGGYNAAGSGVATLDFSKSHPLPSVYPGPVPTPSRAHLDSNSGTGLTGRSRIFTSARPKCCRMGPASSRSGDGRESCGTGLSDGSKPFMVPVSMSAPSNALPPLQQQHSPRTVGSGLMVSPLVTQTSLPPSITFDISRSSRVLTGSWRSRFDTNGDGAGIGSGPKSYFPLLAPSVPAGGSQHGGTAAFLLGSIDDSISLSLRHQLQTDFKHSQSRITIGGGGGGTSLLSRTPEHDPGRPSDEQSEEELDLAPRMQPRTPLPPSPPAPLHEVNDTDPLITEFASGVVGAVTPAVRTSAFSAIMATNSCSASIGSLLPPYPRTGQGPPYGSAGDGSSSATGGGGNGGSGGGGSGGSSSASGMLQQALRQHQKYARWQQRQLQPAPLQREQEPPWQQMVAAAATALTSPAMAAHKAFSYPEALSGPREAPPPQPIQPQSFPSAAITVELKKQDARHGTDISVPTEGDRVLFRDMPVHKATIPPDGGGAGATTRELRKKPTSSAAVQPSSLTPQLGSETHPSHVTLALHAGGQPTTDGKVAMRSWLSEIRIAAQQGLGAAGTVQLTAAHPHWRGATQATSMAMAAATAAATGVGAGASAGCMPKALHTTVKVPGDGSPHCRGDGLLGEAEVCGELASFSSPSLDAKGLSAVGPFQRAVPITCLDKDGDEEGNEAVDRVNGMEDTVGGHLLTDACIGNGMEDEVDGAALLSGIASVGRSAAKAKPFFESLVALQDRVRPGVPLAIAHGAQAASPAGSPRHRHRQVSSNGAHQCAHQGHSSVWAADSASSSTFEYRWRPPTVDRGPGCVGMPPLGSGGGGGGCWAGDASGYGGRMTCGLCVRSVQSHSGSSAAAAVLERTVWIASSGDGSRTDTRLDSGVPNPSMCGASTGDRCASSQWHMHCAHPVQVQRCGVAAGISTSTTNDVALSPFLATSAIEMYERSGISEDCEDSRASVGPPAGWQPGIHPPPGAGSAAAGAAASGGGGVRTFVRLGSTLATCSGSVSAHGHLQTAVAGLVDSSTGAGGNGGYNIAARCGGGGGGSGGGDEIALTVPSGSAGTLSLARVHSGSHNLDEPELWRDETYTEQMG